MHNNAGFVVTTTKVLGGLLKMGAQLCRNWNEKVKFYPRNIVDMEKDLHTYKNGY